MVSVLAEWWTSLERKCNHRTNEERIWGRAWTPKGACWSKTNLRKSRGVEMSLSLKREKRADSLLLNFQANPGDLVAIDSTWQGAKLRTLERQGHCWICNNLESSGCLSVRELLLEDKETSVKQGKFSKEWNHWIGHQRLGCHHCFFPNKDS